MGDGSVHGASPTRVIVKRLAVRAGSGSRCSWPASNCPPPRANRSRRRRPSAGAGAPSWALRWRRRLVVVAALRPPLGLWPSVTAMATDFHTGTGERLQIAPSPQLKIELDTQSSLRRRARRAKASSWCRARPRSKPVLACAWHCSRAGCVIADEGAVRLDVRNTHGLVRVTCLQGSARIEHPQGRLQLQAGQQTRFDERLSGVVAEAVASEVSAWTEGMLVFRRAPLGEVVDEINRYRRGKVLLGESALARAPVSGRFRIDDPDAALAAATDDVAGSASLSGWHRRPWIDEGAGRARRAGLLQARRSQGCATRPSVCSICVAICLHCWKPPAKAPDGASLWFALGVRGV